MKSLVFLSIISFLLLTACHKSENQVFRYLHGAQRQAENKAQIINIINAFNDCLSLPTDELKNKRYKDYTGKENQWDMPTLIMAHYLSIKPMTLSQDNDFYNDIKSKKTQKEIRKILQKLQKAIQN